MTVKVIDGGAPSVAATISPLPVNVTGGNINIIEGAAVASVWSGPHGYMPDNDRQVTDTDPGTTYVAGAGATASDAAKIAATWSTANRAAFLAEFPTARPGLLYGIVVVAWGNFYSYIGDMYNSSDTSTKEYRDRESWAYSSGNFCLRRMFEAKANSGGMWNITFPRPIPFHIGLRNTYDNGNSMIYFCYSLDPDFA